MVWILGWVYYTMDRSCTHRKNKMHKEWQIIICCHSKPAVWRAVWPSKGGEPHGSVRIINNLSCLKGKSVNDGIDKLDFPAVMSSMSKFVKALNIEGKDGYMLKPISISRSDHRICTYSGSNGWTGILWSSPWSLGGLVWLASTTDTKRWC